MWHASIAWHGNRPRPRQDYWVRCMIALRGVGSLDPALEWEEWTGKALHLRRRLNDHEAAGFVLRDVRGTPEADALLAPFRHLLPVGWTE